MIGDVGAQVAPSVGLAGNQPQERGAGGGRGGDDVEARQGTPSPNDVVEVRTHQGRARSRNRCGRCLTHGARLSASHKGSDVTEPRKTTAAALEQLHGMTDAAVTTPETAAAEKQHARGKKTARERVNALLDADSFVELDRLTRHRSQNFGLEKNRPYGDGVVTGYGTVDGRQVAVYSQDFTVYGGSLGEVHGQKIA